MKNVFKVVLIFIFLGLVFGCGKDDDPVVTPLRDYTEQYATDLDLIKTYLKTHKLPSGFNPNTMQHVVFETVTALSPDSFWGTNDATPNSNVLQVQVEKDDITYTVYYLQLQQGSGATSKSPCNLDGVLTSYEGQLLDGTVFDSNFYPQTYFSLTSVIRGWGEVFPKFKTGSYTSNPDGTITYNNFGAGIMFIPSGLAYYANSPDVIPAYSPLIFSFKLYEVQRVDNDGDGIFSYQEDIGSSTGAIPDGYIRVNTTTNEDDTDLDGLPDALDIDDDADGILTKEEAKYKSNGNTYYYPYSGALVDDPLTLNVDETKGIPRKFIGPPIPPSLLPSSVYSDFTDPTRLRRHLDSTAKPPYSDQE